MQQAINLVAIQLVSSPDIDANFVSVIEQIELAANDWDTHLPALVVLPECFAYFGGDDAGTAGLLATSVQQAIFERLRGLARTYHVWLVAGSLPTPSPVPSKMYASALCFDPQGNPIGKYNKIHLFDVDINDNTQSYRESATTLAGDEVLVLETEFGRVGVCICYDLRFSELFNAMVREQAIDYLVVPAAFTQATGEAHWHTLLAARAIEYQCYVIAANQGGTHLNGRQTYGNSAIYSPWGVLLDVIEYQAGFVIAKSDPTLQQHIQRTINVQQQRKLF